MVFVANKEIVIDNLEEALEHPTDKRILAIAEALKRGWSIEKIHNLTKIDRWFLQRLNNIVNTKNQSIKYNSLETIPVDLLKKLKIDGFSDFQIARLVLKEEHNSAIDEGIMKLRRLRKNSGIVPSIKQIDTLAAEHPAQTNYLYLTYHGSENDITNYDNAESVVIFRVRSLPDWQQC